MTTRIAPRWEDGLAASAPLAENFSMKSRLLAAWGVFVLFFSAIGSAHDTTASYVTIRAPADRLELQIKIAAEMAWPAVQATVAPGRIFVVEEFETVGRELLVKFARIAEELSLDGKVVAPTKVQAEVADDNFIFTFSFPRPASGALRLSEKYLQYMPSDYVSRIVVLDSAGKPLASKTVHPASSTFEFSVPPLNAPTASGERK